MKKLLVVFLVCLISISVSVAQEQKVELTATWEELFPFKDVSDWLDEEFIFLPMSVSTQEYGYSKFHTNPKKPYDSISYEDYAGKVIKVINVTKARGYKMWNVVFEVKDTRKKLYAKNVDANAIGIGYLPDIIRARSLFAGKTFWYESDQLVSYDEATDEYSSIDRKKWSPIEIVGVEPAPSHLTGNAIVLLRTPAGEYGFTDVVLSGTNISARLRIYNRFQDRFLVEDPRIIYSWSDRVWSAIEQEKVFIGMTAEQARMSWGDPKDINRTKTAAGSSEQWVYSSGSYLYFKNGKLTTIQN